MKSMSTHSRSMASSTTTPLTSPAALKPRPGLLGSTHGMRPPTWTNREGTRSDSISSSPAALPADFPRWFRLRCCIPHPRMRRMRSPISTNATIPSPGSRWEKKPPGSPCCPKTTARYTCNSPLRFIGSFPRPSWAVRPSKERLRMLKCGRAQPGKSHGSGGFSPHLKPAGRLNDFTFFSFEHYPYQDKPTYSWADLYPEPEYVRHIVQVWKDNGFPPNIPFFMTEGNNGGGAGPSTVKSALWLA